MDDFYKAVLMSCVNTDNAAQSKYKSTILTKQRTSLYQ